MFGSPIGRLRFFAYSALLLVAEAIATIVCISLTTGIKELAESPPGPSRQPLALAILIVSIVLLLARSNLAWRRTRDADGSKWILWPYIVFSAFFALLQSATFLVYDFNGGTSNIGLNLLGLVLIGLWVRLLVARPAGNTWDADGFAATVDAEVRSRVDNGGPPASMAPSQARTIGATPPNATRSVAKDRQGGFGKRRLA